MVAAWGWVKGREKQGVMTLPLTEEQFSSFYRCIAETVGNHENRFVSDTRDVSRLRSC